MAHPQIAAFARLAKENAMPTRLLAGQSTRLGRSMHDIRYDAVHDEFLVTNPFAQAILVFRGGASGEEPPIRIIQGPTTQLTGGLFSGGADRLDVDPVHDEIFIPGGDRILVYPRTGNGDVPPLRIIEGPDTRLRRVNSIAVDPLHHVVVAGTGSRYQDGYAAILIYNRTAEGNVKPRGMIMGPKTGLISVHQLRVNPDRGWIVMAQAGSYGDLEPEEVFIGVWSINDNGNVAPRWKLGGPNSIMKKPRGIALNPKDKEIYVADMRLNAALTYYFPEIF